MPKFKKQAALKQKGQRDKMQPRDVIVSFRLRSSEIEALGSDLETMPAAGVKSVRQYARKLVIDYARDRLVYVNPMDRLIDSDAREQAVLAPPDCTIDNAQLASILLSLFRDHGNWNKLRFFMLGAGWPSRFEKAYREARNDHERAEAARAFLKHVISTRNTAHDHLHAKAGKKRNSYSHSGKHR